MAKIKITPEQSEYLFSCPEFIRKALESDPAKVFEEATDEEVYRWLVEGKKNYDKWASNGSFESIGSVYKEHVTEKNRKRKNKSRWKFWK